MLIQLKLWLDNQTITLDNFEGIRNQLILPFNCAWNGIVRDEMSKRVGRETR